MRNVAVLQAKTAKIVGSTGALSLLAEILIASGQTE